MIPIDKSERREAALVIIGGWCTVVMAVWAAVELVGWAWRWLGVV